MTDIAVARIAEPGRDHAADLYVDGIAHPLTFRDLMYLSSEATGRATEVLAALHREWNWKPPHG